MNPWIGIVVVPTVFSAAMVGLRNYRRRCAPEAEWARKLLHVAMGLLALTAPSLFAERWPVILLTIGFTLFLMALRISPFLKRLFGGVVDGVGRKSLGEIYFPISVGLLFLLSKDNPILFSIPVLILTFPDAAAALIGRHYGRLRYQSFGEGKSIEGSLAFFFAAFLSTHIPLLLLTNIGRAETLLISFALSLLLTLVEAISWRGLDNLFLPLGAYLLLKAYLPLDTAELAAQFGFALVLAVFFGFSCSRRSIVNRNSSQAARFAEKLTPNHTEVSCDSLV